MELIQTIFEVVAFDVLANAAVLVGLIAMVGLMLQHEKPHKILTGTLKTIIGFLVFNIGTAAVASSLTSFQTLFQAGFGIEGILPLAEAMTALAQEKFGAIVSLVMLIGFVSNLIVARITPFKSIFLTGQHNLYFAALISIMFKALGVPDVVIIIFGGIILGFCAAIFPAIAQPYMDKVTGSNEIAIGHYVTLGYALAGWIGSKVGNPEESTEDITLPGWLSIFKDYVIGVAVTMIVIYYVACIAAGQGAVEALSNGQNWLVFPLFEGLKFAGGLYVVITGVRLFLGEIEGAFVGISEKLIPNAKPALDCPVIFGFAPTATVIGFIAAYIGGLLSMAVMSALGALVVIPVAVPYFFIGATAGVFGNATGGWRGCVVGAFVVGILIAVGPALIYSVMANIGLTGTAFPETDFNFIGLLIWYIGRLFVGA
ncbi:MAG: PTS ascorbate transporter subunit IIC [Atopobium sp.]|uniref:PTS ascorbate transporter subunit IIC n=1 Tax=Atopobium sp. TaxID=1872650 RepID=UPI002A8076BC|nr:PTS ascorbate transporter subunit IIC [Atopobium sp.]MDY4523375.1 PTS ascorbate transporter subunit IIC [Atopobium sp.]